VLERCLAKDPAQRYASARDLARELHDLRKRVEGRPLTRRQAIGLGIVATGAIATTSSLGWFLWSGGQRVHALALLPFENPAKDPALDHVCNGLTDALIFRIGVLPNIRVMPHSLVSNFKRTGRDERAFAQEIGADSYLTGSVTKAAGTLTIAASLHEVQTAKKLWFNSFTRADAQAIQESIATEIVYDGIRLQLSEDERRRLVARATDNAQAYELYLKAIAEQLQQTVEATIRQRELLDEVVTLDPKFARAYLQLGGTYSSAAIDGWEPPAECWPRVNEYIRKGLDRAPELPDGHVLTSVYEFFGNWRWESAADAWRLAMRAQGATMLPYNLVARALQEVALGRTGDAVNTMAHVRQLDPLTPLFMVKEAMFLRADGQLERAAAGYLTALRLDPGLRYGSFGLADVRVDQGRFDEAIDIYRQLEDGKNTDLTRILAAARGADGWLRVQRAVARLELGYCDIREKSGGYYIAPIDRAKFAALAGDSKLALRYLEEALDVRDPGVVMLKADRAWDSLRDHPAFQAAVKRVGLP
jgi:TolB-like protein